MARVLLSPEHTDPGGDREDCRTWASVTVLPNPCSRLSLPAPFAPNLAQGALLRRVAVPADLQLRSAPFSRTLPGLVVSLIVPFLLQVYVTWSCVTVLQHMPSLLECNECFVLGIFFFWVMFFDSVVICFWNADIEDFSALWNSKSEENVSKIKPTTTSESESQLGICINAREKDRALNWGLDHFMKIFSCCRRAMVTQSFPWLLQWTRCEVHL